MEKVKKILVAAALLVGAWLIGYVIGRNNIPEPIRVVETETIVKYDTIVVESPKEVRYEVLTEKIRVPVLDTIRVHDTLYLSLPTQRKSYKEDTFYLEISGYNPSLDYIEVYPRTVVISKTETTTQKPSKWHYGIDVGLKYRSAVDKYVVPGIGAELGYNRVTFRAEFGAAMKTKERTFISYEPYMEFGLKYDLVTQ